MSLKVVVHPEAERDLRKIRKKDMESFRRITRTIDRYAETGQGDVRVVVGARAPGERPVLALVVGKRWWRVYFTIVDNEAVLVLGVERRPGAYQPQVIEAARRRLKELGVEME